MTLESLLSGPKEYASVFPKSWSELEALEMTDDVHDALGKFKGVETEEDIYFDDRNLYWQL